ncbi:hypothetical protein P2H44_10900 [Albimonas sp. CAU 1670]|uniref:hypothetical protein n=1 Tax=Albimonas sp. CAU 1670 TaxID=3032599 RepID=UPI0023D9CD5C|nr:hypothetical protein [Albimonas sp. CAU 1670]MDF2233059.1 hypothetical protein [Albimonas sp. CAU 1670]
MLRYGAPVLYAGFLVLSFARIWLNRPGRDPGISGYMLGASISYLVVFGTAYGGVATLVEAFSGEAGPLFWAEVALLAPACWLTWRGLRALFPWPLAMEAEGGPGA